MAVDTTKPTLTGLALPRTIDVRTGGSNALFSIGATDTGSGIDYAYIGLDRNYQTGSGRNMTLYFYGSNDSFADGISSLSQFFGSTTAAGLYNVSYLTLVDKAGNSQSYSQSDLTALGIGTSFEVKSNTAPDTTPPELTALSLPQTIDVSSGGKNASFSVGVSDQGSGVESVYVTLDHSFQTTYGYISTLSFYDSNDSFSDGISSISQFIDSTTGQGTYNITNVTLYDKEGNYRNYSQSDLVALGIDTDFEVQSQAEIDTTGPEISWLSVPDIIDVTSGGRTAAFSLSATDDGLGVETVYLNLDRAFNVGFGSVSSLFFSDSSDSFSDGSSTLNQFFDSTSAVGTYNITSATAYDKAGNSHTYYQSELASLGVPTSFQVANRNLTPTAIVTAPQMVHESDGHFRVSVTLKDVGAANGLLSMSYVLSTAKNGVDVNVPTVTTSYSVSQSPNGDYTLALPEISIIDDLQRENLETVNIRIYAPGLIFDSGSDVENLTISLIDNDFVGTDRNETLTGSARSDYLNGKLGDDILFGLAGNDTLIGEQGKDRLEGGLGADTLTGGLGGDVFAGSRAELAGDTITDFAVGDRILIRDADPAHFSFSRSGDVLSIGAGQSLTLAGFAGRIVAEAAAEGGVALVSKGPVLGDVNGDGRADILWRSDDGALTNWLARANGSFGANGAAARLSAPIDWKVAATADVNGDGRTDIVWRHDNGALIDWLGQSDGTYKANDISYISRISTAWNIAGVADINGDGRADILWRNDNGALTDWISDAAGKFVANDRTAHVGGIPTAWHVVGLADFNGDGRADILWRNDNGALIDWLGRADGGFIANDKAFVSGISTSWHVVGVGDVNGDGRADILWRNDNGSITDWLGQADGTFKANDAVAFVSRVPPKWSIAELADFNSDGRADILWRNTDGGVTDWLARENGSFVANDSVAFTHAPTSWHIEFQSFALA